MTKSCGATPPSWNLLSRSSESPSARDHNSPFSGATMTDQNEDQAGVDVEEWEELIDLEEWAKAGKKPKPAKVYRIRIDKEKKDVTVPSMNGRQILALVNKTPETHMLSQKIHGQAPVPIGSETIVRFDT